MKLTIPTEWAEIKIPMFRKILEIGDDFDLNDNTASLSVLSTFTGVPIPKLSKVRHKDVTDALSEVFKVADKPQPKSLVHFFRMDGIEYGLIPDFTEMSFGEFGDLDTYASGNVWENMEAIIAILYRPVTKKVGKVYDIEDYDANFCAAREKRIGEFVGMDVVIPATVFFYESARNFLSNFQHLQMAAKRPPLVKDGGGTTPTTR